MKRILLIEDNRDIANMLFDYFECLGLTLDYADNGELGFKLASENTFDIILLDLMLPRMDGLTVCNRLREQGNNTPILMLTALDNREDMLKGFNHGADDYLTKPFDLDILEARMNALIRRYRGTVAVTDLKFADIIINQKERIATRQGKNLLLNPTTYKILEMLCKKAPEIVTREEISYQLWQENEPNNDVLRSHIYQLRTQIDKPFNSSILVTVPKIGFRLERQYNE
ncbi:response regulator transcription factor [Aliivibrio fischeri]|uniref:response regulator transcription factor n=1 Tax=Aliivibrio fischeri TaxID=668 RepID=UPI0007C48C13|nr:response regulator transcription factor [Aliivibrio fischeri]MCE7576089.1 response regulator transcription factor [Aliivibrio fischeri]MCE7588379.1 response regulator transcription factor [Aliivibrio fischeri]TGA71940.1 response regulator transcription factor [Aliivibrio fischeri]